MNKRQAEWDEILDAIALGDPVLKAMQNLRKYLHAAGKDADSRLIANAMRRSWRTRNP